MLRRKNNVPKKAVFQESAKEAKKASTSQAELASWDIFLIWAQSFPKYVPRDKEIVIAFENLLENHEERLCDIIIEKINSTFNSSELRALVNSPEIYQYISKVMDRYIEIFSYVEFSQEYRKKVFDSIALLFHNVLFDNKDCVVTEDNPHRLSPFLKSMCKVLTTQCFNLKKPDRLYDFYEHVEKLDMERKFIEILILSAKDGIESFIENTIDLKKNCWEDLEEWIDESICENFCAACRYANYSPVGLDLDKLHTYAQSQLLETRIKQLFETIGNYPNSIPTLEEIKRCIKFPEQRNYLANQFIETIKTRLLHPGSTTIEIISYYILMIRSFLVIDPNGVILDKVCRQTRRYLRERPDTVKYIVSGLLNDDFENNKLKDLYLELQKVSKNKTFNENPDTTMNNDVTINWQPDPIDALPDFKRTKITDVIESVTSLFDSKNLFTNEFLKHFSKELIDAEDFQIQPILEKLELLKVKFGNNNNEFDSLNVMVKDIVESEKIDNAIHNTKDIPEEVKLINEIDFHSTILSYLFWPNDLTKLDNPDNEFQLPKEFEDVYNLYSDFYSKRKLGRILKPVYTLGTVTVELVLSDRTKTFKVTPELASVIYQFTNNVQTLSLKEIIDTLKMDELMAEKAVKYWITEGILEEFEDEKYKVLETSSGDNKSQSEKEAVEIDNLNENNNEEFKLMEKYSPFIIGMLTNLGIMELSKMKNLLTMAIPKEMNFNCNDVELENYLNHLVEEDKLEHVGGKSYKIK